MTSTSDPSGAGPLAEPEPPPGAGPGAGTSKGAGRGGDRGTTDANGADLLRAKQAVIARAQALGFDSIGFTTPDGLGAAPQRLRDALAAGHHGEMDWLEAHAERRSDPRLLMQTCRSIIMLGLNYTPESDPLEALKLRERGVVSTYAKRRDYHDVIKGRLKEIAHVVARSAGCDVKVFVDTAPLMEKPLAQAAGLGWQGKHTNLVSRRHGSWLLLGAILSDAEFPPDARESDHCGRCRACLDVCPTDAFPAPYRLDARRCLAYLTIEYSGVIPEAFRAPMGNRVFGCDDCLAVCPWNKFAQTANDIRMATRTELDDPPLLELLALDDAAFRKRFSGTPVKRTGRQCFLRNVLIAAGNSGDGLLLPLVRSLLSDTAPLVRGMAVWALSRLVSNEAFAAEQAARLGDERDAAVIGEWLSASRRGTRADGQIGSQHRSSEENQ